MRTFQDTFETRKRSFTSAFSICVTVPLRQNQNKEKEPFLKIASSGTFSCNASSKHKLLRVQQSSLKFLITDFYSQKQPWSCSLKMAALFMTEKISYLTWLFSGVSKLKMSTLPIIRILGKLNEPNKSIHSGIWQMVAKIKN